jgi:hypothetical protein
MMQQMSRYSLDDVREAAVTKQEDLRRNAVDVPGYRFDLLLGQARPKRGA